MADHREGGDLRHPLPIVLVTLFVAHLLEAVIYALGLAFLDEMGRGHLMGATIGGPGWFEDHFYFSIASYTTLGLGDIIPSGDIRIVAGLEIAQWPGARVVERIVHILGDGAVVGAQVRVAQPLAQPGISSDRSR